MRRKFFLTTAMLFSLGFVSCGGSGSDTTSTTTQTGQFIDSPVANLEYQTSSGITGKTDSNGYFKYKPGDTVTFKVGKVVIGEAEGQKLVTPLDLVVGENATENDTAIQEKVKLISAFLISLDSDGDPNNGIEIEESAIEELQENVTEEVNLEDVTNGTVDLLPLPENLKEKIKSKLDNAEKHFSDSIYGILKKTLDFMDGKTVSFESASTDKKEICTLSIDTIDDDNQTIKVKFVNCTGEDDNVVFKVESGVPYIYEGDGFKDMIVELEPEEFCMKMPDVGVVCIKPYEGYDEETNTENVSENVSNSALNTIIGTYKGSYVTTYNPTGYCDPSGEIEMNIDKSGIVNGQAITVWGYFYTLSGKLDFSTYGITVSISGSDGNGVLEGKIKNNTITGTWKFTANDGSSCNGTFSIVKQ